MEKLVKQILTKYKDQKLSWPKDWFLKLISLSLAVFLWYFVAGEDRVDMNVQIPVEIVNLPRNLVISNQFKDKLEVTVSGPRGMIRKIPSQEISRTIDLSKGAPGNIVIDNNLDSIRFPRGIRVLRINPTQIILLLDRLIQKEVPVKLVTSGELPEEYELESIKIEPDKLSVSGPNEILGEEQIFNTLPLDLTKFTATSTKQVSLDLKPEVAKLIGESIVTVQVSIKDKLVAKNIRRIPITVEGLSANQSAKLSDKKVKITARLPLALIKKTKSLKTLFEAVVEAKLPDGTHELKVTVRGKPDSGIIVDEISPPAITAKIKSEEPK